MHDLVPVAVLDSCVVSVVLQVVPEHRLEQVRVRVGLRDCENLTPEHCVDVAGNHVSPPLSAQAVQAVAQTLRQGGGGGGPDGNDVKVKAGGEGGNAAGTQLEAGALPPPLGQDSTTSCGLDNRPA